MSSIAIITDSTSYIPKEELEKYEISIVPLQVIFGAESYREGYDLDVDEFYKKLEHAKHLPTTSQPPVGEFVETYEKLSQQADHLISIHLSSGISGTYQSAKTAASMLSHISIDVVDSEIACYALGFMVVEAAKMAKEGRSREEILERVDYIRKTRRAYFLVEDLNHLYRGGRLTAAQMMVGNLLRIKPILMFENKKIQPFEKIRTHRRAKERIMGFFEEDAKKGKPIRLSIIQANVYEEAKEWLEEIQNKYPHVDGNITPFGPVIGTHTGPGTIGITWYFV
ncbi:DegV family protein [Microaerobacter geothermalis]|uniref:DegV family protein n=1 Tax=Microaerobacter geothermalis TaxID=674972 RepID=UPI001F2F97AC|nr:DegV family protein [Microaerobacter geothermalis]MCF6093401.1 DegV family protein [Microaerobacter geothermalis]